MNSTLLRIATLVVTTGPLAAACSNSNESGSTSDGGGDGTSPPSSSSSGSSSGTRSSASGSSGNTAVDVEPDSSTSTGPRSGTGSGDDSGFDSGDSAHNPYDSGANVSDDSGGNSETGADSSLGNGADSSSDGAMGPRFVGVSAGNRSACALTTTGNVECWGENFEGVLGNDSTTDSFFFPVSVTGLSGGVSALSAGENVCVVTGGGVECWGSNVWGTLGNNSTTNSPIPVQVFGIASGATAVSVGGSSVCAVIAGGVECWGENADGTLGNNSMTNSPIPVQVTGLASGALNVSVGNYSACALTVDGAVECWGNNAAGELGNNSMTDSLVPVPVVGLTSGVLSVSVGNGTACAVTAGGGVECWGSSGGLGNGLETNSLVPVQVTGITSGATAVSVGFDSVCAVTAGGGIECWGTNYYGQLGNGTTINSLIPTQVVGFTSGAIAVSVGAEFACAVTMGGRVECWGTNVAGQLGNDSTANSLVPIPIGVTNGLLDAGADASDSGAATDAECPSSPEQTLIECSGACVDTTSDLDNCGGCGVQCPQGSGAPLCLGGQCECIGISCPNGCFDPSDTCTCDNPNLGCPAGTMCQAGPCQDEQCQGGFCLSCSAPGANCPIGQ
jgi:alpha-tubulin suppressor-like RCC1 family protein